MNTLFFFWLNAKIASSSLALPWTTQIRHRRNTIMYTVGPVKMFWSYFVVKRFRFVDVFHGCWLNATAEHHRGDHGAYERRRHGNRGATHRKFRGVAPERVFCILRFTRLCARLVAYLGRRTQMAGCDGDLRS